MSAPRAPAPPSRRPPPSVPPPRDGAGPASAAAALPTPPPAPVGASPSPPAARAASLKPPSVRPPPPRRVPSEIELSELDAEDEDLIEVEPSEAASAPTTEDAQASETDEESIDLLDSPSGEAVAATDSGPPPPPLRGQKPVVPPAVSSPPRWAPQRPTGAPTPPRPEATLSIHPEAYGDLPEVQEHPTLSLADREQVTQELLALCLEELKETRDKARRARLHYEVARLSEVPQGDLDTALEHYQQARTLVPKHPPTLAGLRRVRILRGEWEAAQKVLLEELETAPSPAERAALSYFRGVIFERRLGRVAEARAAYGQALAHLPGDVGSLRALLRIARIEKKPGDTQKLLESLVESAGDDSGLVASRLSTRARSPDPKEVDGAEILAFHQRSIDADPLASASLANAERLTSLQGRFDHLVRLADTRVRLLTEPSRRGAILLQSAEVLAEKLGDTAAAIRVLEQATRERPTDLLILSRLVELSHRLGDHTGELRHLLKLEHLEQELGLKVEYRLKIAELYRHRLESAADAVVWFEKARELSPTHPGAADSLADLYRQGEDWRGLAQVLAGREAVCDDPTQRVALLVELAEIHEAHLANPEQAIIWLKSAVGLAPEHPGAFRALCRILHQERRFAELVEVHEAAADSAQDDVSTVAHLLATATICEDVLGRYGQALSAYQRILARESHHLLALRGVQRVAVSSNQPDLAIEALKQEVQTVTTPGRKVPLLVRAAEVSERHLRNHEQAVELYQEATRLDPSCRPALSALGRIFRAQGQYSELVSVMQMELEVLGDRRHRCEHLLRMGQIAEDLLADDDLALQNFKKAMLEDPDSRHAAECVERTLQRRGEHAALARTLESRLHHEKDAQRRLATALQLGRIYEVRLGLLKEALRAYATAAEVDAADQNAREGCTRVFSLLGDYPSLATALDEQSAQPGDRTAALMALLWAAEVYEEHMGLPGEAAQRYERVLELQPGHRGALDSLERLYSELADQEAHQRILDQQAQAYGSVGERIASLRETLRLLEIDAAGADQARSAAAQRILELAPEDERALTALELLHIHHQDLAGLAQIDRTRIATATVSEVRSVYRTRLGEFLEAKNPEQAVQLHRPALAEDPENIGAARGLTRLAEQLGQVELLTFAAEAEARVVKNPERVSHLLRRAAALEVRSGRHQEAVAILSRCLALHPDDSACAQDLVRLMSATGQHEELIALLEEAATSAHAPEVRAGHWITVARLLVSVRNDLPAAIAALLRVEKTQPGHYPALVELAELYIKDRQWAFAATRLEKAISVSPSEQEGISARLRLAEIAHEHLDRTADAARLLREVLRGQPMNRTALRRLLHIEVDGGKPSARETAEAWVKVSEGAELAEALTTLGRLQRDAKQTAAALESLTRAVAIIGYDDKGAGRDLTRLYEASQRSGQSPDWLNFARALQSYCQSQAVEGDRERTHLELSRIHFDRCSQPVEGESALRRGLAQIPESTALLRELCERLVSMRQYERALPEVRRLLDRDPASAKVWGLLVECCDSLGKNAEAYLATGALVYLGGGSELQRSTWHARQPRPGMGSEGGAMAGLSHALTSQVSEETHGLLSQMSPLLAKIYPQDLARLGLSARERVGARGSHPVRPLLDRILRLFRGIEVDLYPAPAGSGMGLVLADPCGIAVPADFAGLTEVQQTFCLTRFACAVATDQQVSVAQGTAATGRLLAATCHALGVAPPPGASGGEEMLELSRRVGKALPWLARGRFEDAARRYAAVAEPFIEDGARTWRLAALRLALIVSDDIGCLSLVGDQATHLLAVPERERDDVVEQLLAFWVSEAAMALRRQLGAG